MRKPSRLWPPHQTLHWSVTLIMQSWWQRGAGRLARSIIRARRADREKRRAGRLGSVPGRIRRGFPFTSARRHAALRGFMRRSHTNLHAPCLLCDA